MYYKPNAQARNITCQKKKKILFFLTYSIDDSII